MKMTAPLPAPVIPARRKPVPASNQALDRLLRLTLALLLVVGGWAAWQWHRGWQQLESRMAPERALHSQPSSAKVPAEVIDGPCSSAESSRSIPKARRANLQGVVTLDAMIAADGTVVNLHPLSGPDALVSAAMDAARWWRFRPCIASAANPRRLKPRCPSSSGPRS